MKQKLLLIVALLCSAFSPLRSADVRGVAIPTNKSGVYLAHIYNNNKYLYMTASNTLAWMSQVPSNKWCITYNAENKTFTLSRRSMSIYLAWGSNGNDAAKFGDNTTSGSCELYGTYTTKNTYNGANYMFYLWDREKQKALLLSAPASGETGPLQAVREDMGTLLDDEDPAFPAGHLEKWLLVDVESADGENKANMTISKTAEYGTFVAPFSVDLPVGVTAYQVESFTEADNTADDYVEGDIYTLNLKAVAGAQATTMTLPANTPVIVHAAALNETLSQDFYGNPTGTENANRDRFLTGTYELQEAEVGTYILQYEQERAAFLLVSGEEELYCGKNRAYLTLPEDVAAAGIKAFNLSGIETGITRIPVADSNELQDNAIYDLTGRRLAEKPARGLYIQNGKKILVK